MLFFWVCCGRGYEEGLTINILGLVPVELANLELAVGGLGSAITAGQVINDQTQDVVAGDVLERGLQLGNVLDRVQPQEAADVGDLGRLGRQGRVRDGLDGCLDLGAVELVGVQRVLLPHVGAGVERDG